MIAAPEVTVVIATRDRWPLLSTRALPSALSQTGLEVEIVVVDDGSVDETAQRITELADPRVRLVRHASSRGQGAALSSGIAAASARWVAFLDDDDAWSPRKLRAQLDAASQRDASFVYTSLVAVDQHGRILDVRIAPDPDRVSRDLNASNVIACPSIVLVRADLLTEIGGLDEEFDELTDWDLWLRLTAAGTAAACPEVLVAYLMHPSNRRLLDELDVGAEFDRLRQKHRGRAGSPARGLERAGFERWVAAGHLRGGRRLPAARFYVRAAVAGRSPGDLARALASPFGDRGLYLRSALRRRRLSRLLAGQDLSWIPGRERPGGAA